MSLAHARHRSFVDETMRLVGGALGAKWLVFYEVDRRLNLREFVLEGVPPGCHGRYVREMHAYDPLHVRRVAGLDVPVACLQDAARYAPPEDIRAYRGFLRSFAAVDALELMFACDGAIVAGLNVTWTEHDAAPTAATYSLAAQLQRYIQYNLTGRLASAHRGWLEVAGAYGLTPREREVALLVCRGHTNAAIATCLEIELSTVKTHLLRIYDKCEVDSRAGLVARLSDPAS